jgi:hypothetical protein
VHSHDWLYAIRTLRRSPRFTITVALTLALGIGANTAIFSFLNAIYLRPLPYPHADRLTTLSELDEKGRARGASAAAYLEWRDNPAFSDVGAWSWNVATISGGPWPERVQVQMVAGDYFRALGVQPETGRLFLPEEEQGGGCSVLLSARLWRSWFGNTRDLAAKPILVEGAPARSPA